MFERNEVERVRAQPLPERPARMVLVNFAETKVTRRPGGSS